MRTCALVLQVTNSSVCERQTGVDQLSDARLLITLIGQTLQCRDALRCIDPCIECMLYVSDVIFPVTFKALISVKLF